MGGGYVGVAMVPEAIFEKLERMEITGTKLSKSRVLDGTSILSFLLGLETTLKLGLYTK